MVLSDSFIELLTEETRARAEQTYVAPDGRLLSWRGFRLTMRSVVCDARRVEPMAGHVYQTILDTGAPISVFPQEAWSRFESEIEFLPFPSESEANEAHVNLIGGRARFRLGTVWIVARDRQNRNLRPVRVLAQFLLDPIPRFVVPLVGLWQSVLQGRRLSMIPALETRTGQRWWLHEA